MTELRRLHTEAFPPLSEEELNILSRKCPAWITECAQCFWAFRRVHETHTPEAALYGDYCFGRFSAHLAEIDSVSLNDAFAKFLGEDAVRAKTFEEYLDFLGRAVML